MGDTLGKQTGINLEHFAGEWKLFGRKWGADEGERNAAGRPLCQQCPEGWYGEGGGRRVQGGECLSQRNRSLILGAEMLTGRSVKDKGSGGIW